MWAGLLCDRSRLATVLATAGWACVLLPRRDGPLWATLTVLTCCWLTATRPGALWSRLGQPTRWLVAGLAAVPPLTPIVNADLGFNLALTLAPLGLVVVELLARCWERLKTRSARRALVGCSLGAAVLIAATAAATRSGGFKAETMRLIVSNTGEHLRQLVGVLGWLTTPVPTMAVYLFWALVGGLAVVALLEYRRAVAVYLAALAAAIVVAWFLTLGQRADYGGYWQGRYTMPFAVGLPLMLVWRPFSTSWLVDRLSRAVCWSSWTIANLAFVSAQQRWGVGVSGSWYPWDWDTWGAPVSPWLLVIVHGIGTAAIVLLCSQAPDGTAGGSNNSHAGEPDHFERQSLVSLLQHGSHDEMSVAEPTGCGGGSNSREGWNPVFALRLGVRRTISTPSRVKRDADGAYGARESNDDLRRENGRS